MGLFDDVRRLCKNYVNNSEEMSYFHQPCKQNQNLHKGVNDLKKFLMKILVKIK